MDRTEKSKDLVELGSCSGCGYSGNPSENRFCGRCGASLERSLARVRELGSRTEDNRVTLRERFLPDKLGPVGKTVAVSLVAAAANVGLTWLRYWLQKTEHAALPHDVGRVRREDELGSGNLEYLHGYFLKEAALLLREEGEVRVWFSSELTVRNNHAKR